MLTKLSPRCPRQGKASLWLAAEASCSSSCCHNSTSRSARSTTRQVHRLLLATRTWRGHQGIQTLGRFFERRRYAGCHLSLAYATSPSADKQCERVWRGSEASSSAEHASAQGVAEVSSEEGSTADRGPRGTRTEALLPRGMPCACTRAPLRRIDDSSSCSQQQTPFV